MTRTTKTSTKGQNTKVGKNKSTKKATPKRDEKLHGERTPRKIINWKEYNEALVRRGQFTLWISDDVIEHWLHDNGGNKVGRPFTYSNLAIETLLTIREFFRTTYRATEGFGRALANLVQADIAIPDFTSLAKRAAKLGIDIDVTQYKGKIDVVVDSTGLKVYGEGEWKVKKHGWAKHRTWRKLHLAINEKTQEIEAEVLTDNATDDAAVVDELLNQTKNRTKKFGGDGAYDKWKVYRTLDRRGIVPIIPPRKNAKIKRNGNSRMPPLPRDEAIEGFANWDERSGNGKWVITAVRCRKRRCTE